MKKRINDIFFSFPVQLLGLHCRNNLLLIFIWILLTALVTGNLGQVFGVKYLFLTPEYMGEVDFISFFFLGLAFGGFFITWNLTSYLLDAHLFPFLASLGKPFTKFCLNNLIVPLAFLSIYIYSMVHFQSYSEFWKAGKIFYHFLGFATGTTVLILLSALYFQYTNKDILNFLKRRKNEPPNLLKNIAPGRRRTIDYDAMRSEEKMWRVDTYLTIALKPRLVRSVSHYDVKTLRRVFRQNHLNAMIVQLFGLVLLIALGYMIDKPYFRIPAAANIFILASVLVAIIGAITYWFDKWKYPVVILLLFGINWLTSFDAFSHKNKAYGLDYSKEMSEYTYSKLDSISSASIVEKDKLATLEILENWKRKAQKTSGEKPKMVIYCVSGGGLKAAVWAMQVIQRTDSLTQGHLMNHTALITGASGGMIGASYLREIYLRKAQGENLNVYDRQYVDNISKDLLNSLTFTIVSNDLFLPWTTFETGGQVYKKDRGYIFEKQLNENTENAFTKRIGEYKSIEQEVAIPMLYITPSIVNDGRRMIISPHGVSFMTIAPIGVEKREVLEIDAVDFGKVFAEQGADNMLFSTALRMNATYPYILPNVYLPSEPGLEVMDAGFRDNYGITSATRFVHVFKDWIKENTSGVVMVQISSLDKIEEIEPTDEGGILETMFNPLGIAGQIMNLQDFEHDNSLGFIYDVLGKENFEIIRFIYHPGKNNERASLTFHLTQREKENILNSFYLPKNQESLRRLLEVMDYPKIVQD